MVTLIELKKAKRMALKNHDENAQDVLGVMIGDYQKAEADKRGQGKERNDADRVSLLNKVKKELLDEKARYLAGNKQEEVKNIDLQIKIVESYLPQRRNEDEIKAVIEGLEDRSIKNVRVVFKTKYAGKADRGLVSKIARSYQGK
ncbi:MAG: GatB/YqeY domain-containing protein [Candidatus Enterosoma sp.]|nr:GatB/YqeY domain-containing protein [Mollicutes bacterium]MDD7613838.1 GatB/YqeY domain-containing protein [Mollicutes bacterium]MDY4642801.1 GatB/YqeY domain-containing protein [Candidatus Enterosoma sp.]MDY4782769.1 GatB/YqeY domain-containing protein [Candidatus Enterosoma sp.]MDY5852096.1 GatB/YqeY domain-containing protein [Candidatus Enterosoma sp.]